MVSTVVLRSVFCLFYISSVFCNRTLYLENDFDQVTTELKEEDVEDEILDLLGLADPDAKQNWTLDSISQPAPNFLLKMYEKINEGKVQADNSVIRKRRFADFDDADKLITPLDELELHESDNVMTFMDSYIPLFDEPVFKRRQEHVIWFNTSQIPDGVSLTAAQLKVYKHEGRQRHKYYEVSVFIINIQDTNEVGLNLVSSIQIASDYEGWLQLNVTKAVANWHKGATTNNGFYLEVNMVDEFLKKEVSMSSSGFAGMKSGANTKPFMVGYFRNDQETSFNKLKRKQNQRKRRQHSGNTGRIKKPDPSKNRRSCQKLNFSVDFKKLNWLNWIVAPEKFDSYFCSGDCSFPLNDINTTNHAIIQTLAHLKNPDLPKPCCAPTSLTSIAIIYHVSKEVVNMKKYSNMVVKSCGCL